MMVSARTTFTLDRKTAERARLFKIDIAAAAPAGVEAAIRAAAAEADRPAYRRHPEKTDPFWPMVEAWTNVRSTEETDG